MIKILIEVETVNNKIVLLSVLLGVANIAAMDVVVTKSVSDEMVAFLVENEEVKISAGYCTYMEALTDALDVYRGSVVPLPNVTLEAWSFIQHQLERIYPHAPFEEEGLVQDVVTILSELTSERLVRVIDAANYLGIPFILKSAVTVVTDRSLQEFSSDHCASLPQPILGEIIYAKTRKFLGLIPLRPLVKIDFPSYIPRYNTHLMSLFITLSGTIVSEWSDRIVRVYDAKGVQLTVFDISTMDESCIIVTKDGRIVLGSPYGAMRVLNLNGDLLTVYQGHKDKVTSATVTTDGTLVTGSIDETVRIWHKQSARPSVCEGHEAAIMKVYVTTDGRIVSGSWDRTIRVWDMKGNQLALCRHDEKMVKLCLTNDYKIVSRTNCGRLSVWDLEGNLLSDFVWHGVNYGLLYTTNENNILVGCGDGGLRLYDTQGIPLAEDHSHCYAVTCVCIAKDGMIVSGGRDERVVVYDKHCNPLLRCYGHKDSARYFWMTDDSLLVSGDYEAFYIWDFHLYRELANLDVDQLKVLWEVLERAALGSEKDKDMYWKEVMKILGEEESSYCIIL